MMSGLLSGPDIPGDSKGVSRASLEGLPKYKH